MKNVWRKFCFLILIGISGVFVAYYCAYAKSGDIKTVAPKALIGEEFLDSRLSEVNLFNLKSYPWSIVFTYMLHDAGIPGGMVLDSTWNGKGVRRTRTELAQLSSPRNLLEKICSEHPSYEWKLSSGVINILPKNMKKPHLKLLNQKIKTFSVESDSLRKAVSLLAEENDIPVSFGPFGGGAKSPTSLMRRYSCHNASFVGCLNAFVKQAGTADWRLVYDNRNKRYSISVRPAFNQ